MSTSVVTDVTEATHIADLENTPTWPWHVDAPRVIGTAFLLPVVLYTIQVIIDGLVDR
jgi:hypothetical protein